MKDIYQKYLKFVQTKTAPFILVSVVILFLSDAGTVYYIFSTILPTAIEKAVITQFHMQGITSVGSNSLEVKEISQLMTQTMSLMFALMGLWQSVVYYLTYKQKNWALKYVRSYAFFGFILTLTMLPSEFKLGHHFWFGFNALTVIAYFIIWLGIRDLLKK